MRCDYILALTFAFAFFGCASDRASVAMLNQYEAHVDHYDKIITIYKNSVPVRRFVSDRVVESETETKWRQLSIEVLSELKTGIEATEKEINAFALSGNEGDGRAGEVNQRATILKREIAVLIFALKPPIVFQPPPASPPPAPK